MTKRSSPRRKAAIREDLKRVDFSLASGARAYPTLKETPPEHLDPGGKTAGWLSPLRLVLLTAKQKHKVNKTEHKHVVHDVQDVPLPIANPIPILINSQTANLSVVSISSQHYSERQSMILHI